MRSPFVVAACVCLATVAATPAAPAAEQSCRGQRPFVSVHVPDTLGDRGFGEQVVAQLNASLAARGIDVCRDAARTTVPIARVVLVADPAERVTITVEAQDAVTRKRVARDFDLTALPRDAWALALAVGADEILRASWAELALRTKQDDRAAAPAPVQSIVEEGVVPEEDQAERALTLGVAGVADAFSAGHTQVGVDLRAAAYVLPPVSLVLSAGLRTGLAAESASGSVRSNASVLGIGGNVLVTPAQAAAGVELGLRAQVLRLEFRGEAEAGAGDSTASATAVTTLAAVSAFYAPDPALRLFVEVCAVYPLRGAAARDGDTTATAVDGLGGSLALGLVGVL